MGWWGGEETEPGGGGCGGGCTSSPPVACLALPCLPSSPLIPPLILPLLPPACPPPPPSPPPPPAPAPQATAKGISLLAEAIQQQGGSDAVSLRVAEQYLQSFGEIAKSGTTVLLPAATHDPASMVASALSIYRSVTAGGGGGGSPAAESAPSVAAPQPSGNSGGGGRATLQQQQQQQQHAKVEAARAALKLGSAPLPKFSLQHALE